MSRCTFCGFENEINGANNACSNCGHELLDSVKTVNTIFYESNPEIPLQITLKENDQLHLDGLDYRVDSKIGVGGFGTVYRILHGNHEYALKILDLWKKRPNEWIQLKGRFKQSCIASNISSPFLVRTYSNGFILGNPYLIMEYCPNNHLGKRMEDFQNFQNFNKMGIAVLEGLAALHKNGVVHRDVKPENILFDKNDEAKLTDFDISVFIDKRETVRNWLGKVKEVWGTALYAPPEQLDFKKAYALTRPTLDIFAFGVTMYETLSGGIYPFGSFEEYQQDPIAYYDKIRKGAFIPIEKQVKDLPLSWINIINGCLHPNPEKRIPNAMKALEILKLTQMPGSRQQAPNAAKVGLLKIMNGEESGKIYNLDDLLRRKNNSILTLGWNNGKQKKNNDIPVVETYTRLISSAHSTLEKHSQKWYIRDGQWTQNEWKNSLNGTYVNNVLIRDQAHLLTEGDILTVGDTTLKFFDSAQ